MHLREICLDRYPVVVERDELRHQLEDMIKVQEKLLAEKDFYKVRTLYFLYFVIEQNPVYEKDKTLIFPCYNSANSRSYKKRSKGLLSTDQLTRPRAVFA